MINCLGIKNFKCFENELIPIAPFTLLSGINGMGKTSVIQSLLLLRQSHLAGALSRDGAILNGPLLEIGTGEDAYYEDAKENCPISFDIKTAGGFSSSWSFEYKQGRVLQPLIVNDSNQACYEEQLFSTEFHYLKAERIGPRTCYRMPSHEELRYNRIGNAGEFCAHFFAQRERQAIPIAGLQHYGQSIKELREQVQSWISEISPNTRIRLLERTGTDQIEMSFSFLREGVGESRGFRPTNVGFGLTYSLPIFVSVLSSPPGSFLIIENPEAHLHPRGQVAMGKFLARAAGMGIQLIVETHSDHILNGVRIAIKNKLLTPEDTVIHYFSRSDGSYKSTRTSPSINNDGRLNFWPDGFFDEWEKGLAELF